MTYRWLTLLCAAVLAAISAGPAWAAERPLTGAEIQAALADHTVQGEDGGKIWQQIFQKSGGTSYTSMERIEGSGGSRRQYCSHGRRTRPGTAMR